MGFDNTEFEAALELERQRLGEYGTFDMQESCEQCGGFLNEKSKHGICLHCLAVQTENMIRDVAEREITLSPDDDELIFAMECLCFLADNTDFSKVVADYLD